MKVTDATEVFLKVFKSNFLRSRCVLHNFVNSQFCSFCFLMFCTKSNETEKSSVWRAGVLLMIEWKEDLAASACPKIPKKLCLQLLSFSRSFSFQRNLSGFELNFRLQKSVADSNKHELPKNPKEMGTNRQKRSH